MLVFKLSPRMVVSHILPSFVHDEEIKEETLAAETRLCQNMGIKGYINFHNSEISKAQKAKKKHFWRGYKRAYYEQLCAYFSMTENTRLPITQLSLA